MCAKAAAKMMTVEDDLLDLIDDVELNFLEPALFIGEPLKGNNFIVVHTCPFCRASMQTMGVGHGIYYCSHCASKRTRNVEMTRSYEALEVLE